MTTNSPAATVVANAAALICLALGAAYAIDRLTIWWGGSAWALCSVFPLVDSLLAYTVGMLLAVVGMTLWAFSGFKNNTGGFLAAGGAFLALLPVILLSAFGVSCS